MILFEAIGAAATPDGVVLHALALVGTLAGKCPLRRARHTRFETF
jgi:hypothetical protein